MIRFRPFFSCSVETFVGGFWWGLWPGRVEGRISGGGGGYLCVMAAGTGVSGVNAKPGRQAAGQGPGEQGKKRKKRKRKKKWGEGKRVVPMTWLIYQMSMHFSHKGLSLCQMHG